MTLNYAMVGFQAWHLQELERSGTPRDGWLSFPAELRLGLEHTFAWTALLEGKPLACGGLIEIWPGRYVAWVFLNDHTGKHMRYITRCAKWVLKQVKGRIEMSVKLSFGEGHRWARMLGFEVETSRMRQYGHDGSDHTGYVRFN